MVEMHLAAVRVELPSHTPILLLTEMGEGNRTLPIYVGPAEAQAIAYALQQVETPRPLTHDLMIDLLEELGAGLESVTITELRETTFYAELNVKVGAKRLSISSRPSDAVALAIRARSPIYADDSLVESEGIVLEIEDSGEAEDAEALVSDFRQFIEEVRPEDFEP